MKRYQTWAAMGLILAMGVAGYILSWSAGGGDRGGGGGGGGGGRGERVDQGQGAGGGTGQGLSQGVDLRAEQRDLTPGMGSALFVTSVTTDGGGNAWFGTEGDGVYQFNPRKAEGEQWTHFTSKDGLGDDFAYALASDLQGRVWVGHLNHGVSVWNGSKWQNYEPVAGLSKAGSLAGPLGERVFGMAVAPDYETGRMGRVPMFHDGLTGKDSPVGGSVWMSTSLGIAVYFPATKTWSYVGRNEGLPSDQTNGVAFGADGTVYVATQCDGVAIGRAADHYAKWEQVTGPWELPTAGRGKGLPSNLIDAVFVGRDQTVYAATTAGLAWSSDGGKSWEYVRGTEWAEKVRRRFDGAPAGWSAGEEGMLGEDFTTAVAEDEAGNIVVGHRGAACDVLTARASRKLGTIAGQKGTSLAVMGGTVFGGGYGDGAWLMGEATGGVARAAAATDMPEAAAAPEGAVLSELIRRASSANDDGPVAQLLGEDWQTQGDWTGRYGRQYGVLCAGNGMDDLFFTSSGFSVKKALDPHFQGKESARNWLEGKASDSASSLWDCFTGTRREGQWNDHGEAYGPLVQGPDLWVTVKLPEGLYRVGLYFYPYRGHLHAVAHEFRDMAIEVGEEPADGGTWTALARSRVESFQGGVYKQFLMEGGRSYQVRLERNYSYNALMSGVFIDRLKGVATGHEFPGLPCMGHASYDPPKLSAGLGGTLGEMVPAWQQLMTNKGGAALNRATRVLMYRAAALDGPTEAKELLRWWMPLWTPEDKAGWKAGMTKGWEGFLDVNSSLKERLGGQGPQF